MWNWSVVRLLTAVTLEIMCFVLITGGSVVCLGIVESWQNFVRCRSASGYSKFRHLGLVVFAYIEAMVAFHSLAWNGGLSAIVLYI